MPKRNSTGSSAQQYPKLVKWIENKQVEGLKFRKELRLKIQNQYPVLWNSFKLKSNRRVNATGLFKFLGLPYRARCLTCEKEIGLNPQKLTLKTYCNSTCSGKNERTREIYKNTCRERYNVEHTSKRETVKKKILKGWLKFRGGHPMKDPRVKNKMENTFVRRYGVNHPSKMPDFNEKVRVTSIRLRGYEHPLMDPQVKSLRLANCRVKYGVDYPIQSREVFARNRSSLYSTKEFYDKTGTLFKVNGYEGEVLRFLDDNSNVVKKKSLLDDPICIRYNTGRGDSLRSYYPDLCTELKDGRRLLIEVKSIYTLSGQDFLGNNLAKFKAATIACQKRKTWQFWLAVFVPGKGIFWLKEPSSLAQLLKFMDKIPGHST